jgi:hypothetical protein
MALCSTAEFIINCYNITHLIFYSTLNSLHVLKIKFLCLPTLPLFLASHPCDEIMRVLVYVEEILIHGAIIKDRGIGLKSLKYIFAHHHRHRERASDSYMHV